MPRFEDRLWGELADRHGALLAEMPPLGLAAARPQRRTLRAPAAALALALCVAAIALVFSLTPGGGTPAYAVTQNPDGTVTVTIDELTGVRGANERLVALGVPVRTAPVQAGCTTHAGEYTPVPLLTLPRRPYEYEGRPGASTVKIDPRSIPAGDTLLLSAREIEPGVVTLGLAVYKGAAPQCLPPAAG
jgi:hypothetical protein